MRNYIFKKNKRNQAFAKISVIVYKTYTTKNRLINVSKSNTTEVIARKSNTT